MSNVTSPRPALVVVIAEDEHLIRMLAAEVLSDEGYEIREAEHAARALAVLEAEAEGVHVLFTDIHMPGEMNGIQLARHVDARWPWIGLVVTSAITPVADACLPARCLFLPKPYAPHHVINHVRKVAPPGHGPTFRPA